MSPELQRLILIARRHPRLALRCYQRLQQQASAAGNTACALDVLYQRYFTLERLGEAGQLQEELEHGLQLARQQCLAVQAGKLLEALGRVHFTHSEYREAIDCWTQCIDNSLLSGDLASGVEARIGLSQISNELGDPGQGARYFMDAAGLIDQLDDHYLAAKLALNRGVNYFHFNRIDDAEQQFRLGLQHAQEGGIGEYVAEAYWHIGHVLYDRCDYAAARQHTELALQLAQKHGYLWLRSVAYDTLASVLQAQGDVPAAMVLCEQALEFAELTGSLYQQARHLGTLSALAEQQQDIPRALAWARRQHAVEAEMNRLSAPERMQALRDYDLLQKPVDEQLLDLSADPLINHGTQSALQLLAERAAGILRIDWLGVWVFERPARQCRCVAQSPQGQLAQIVLGASQQPQLCRHLLATASPVVAPDARLHPAAGDLLALFPGLTVQSALEMPLRVLNATVGVVSFVQTGSPRKWSREDQQRAAHVCHLFERVFVNQERERLQEEMQLSEKMASLGRLVAGVAHEINTPVGISITAISHLQGELKSLGLQLAEGRLAKSALQAFMHTANDSVGLTLRNLERAAGLITSFKEVAVDQGSDVFRAISLRHYLEEIFSNLGPVLRRSGHAWELAFPDGDIECQTYPGALAQIITNLVNNSLLHGFEQQQHGRMTVTVRRSEGLDVLLEYRDDGAGMAPDILRRMFDPFFTTKLGQGGSGLGMNIVYNLVTGRLKGRISAESQPGQGVRFLIGLPQLEPTAE
ncbi:ATP-binding protein [Chitinilyticum piscinae]|uniref:histidine kinase n=1 Tax=Chitinilyticum piscinae TaxID=2866724 RepID=A0A8J7K0P7_9NEIS|nr:ATP-binding protein [Chitinilyticum piscinae]MBE9608201.1 GAF domain-containing protein [Chitinilyticum piscinae]